MIPIYAVVTMIIGHAAGFLAASGMLSMWAIRAAMLSIPAVAATVSLKLPPFEKALLASMLAVVLGLTSNCPASVWRQVFGLAVMAGWYATAIIVSNENEAQMIVIIVTASIWGLDVLQNRSTIVYKDPKKSF